MNNTFEVALNSHTKTLLQTEYAFKNLLFFLPHNSPSYKIQALHSINKLSSLNENMKIFRTHTSVSNTLIEHLSKLYNTDNIDTTKLDSLIGNLSSITNSKEASYNFQNDLLTSFLDNAKGGNDYILSQAVDSMENTKSVMSVYNWYKNYEAIKTNNDTILQVVRNLSSLHQANNTNLPFKISDNNKFSIRLITLQFNSSVKNIIPVVNKKDNNIEIKFSNIHKEHNNYLYDIYSLSI